MMTELGFRLVCFATNLLWLSSPQYIYIYISGLRIPIGALSRHIGLGASWGSFWGTISKGPLCGGGARQLYDNHCGSYCDPPYPYPQPAERHLKLFATGLLPRVLAPSSGKERIVSAASWRQIISRNPSVSHRR